MIASDRAAKAQRTNWFVAFEVSAPAIPLHAAPTLVRTFHPADLHATIAFLGPVDEASARAGWDALALAIAARPIVLGDVVPLGVSALSAKIDDDVVTQAMHARQAVWRAAGARIDDRPPLAHVTVARIGRRATEADRSAAIAWAAALRLGGVPARIDRVALYSGLADRRERLFRIVESRAL